MLEKNLTVELPSEPLAIQPLPADAPEWAVTLNENIGVIVSAMNQTMASVDTIAREVAPMVDSLSNSPLIRMIGGK